jgi:RimJ/RimL family protein N-acetyltransferase
LVFGEDARVAQWAAEHSDTGNAWDGKYVAIGLEQHGELIAALGFTEYLPGGSVRGHICAIEGKRWLTRPFLRMIFLYPFMQLKVQRFNAWIPAKNGAVKRFVEHLGFTLESTMVRALANDDVLIYRMFIEESAWKKWVRP